MSGDREDVGSVAEEAAKLLGALSDWAKDAAHDVDEHIATGAAECTYCPICRTVHVVRELSPEVRDQLASAATAFLQAATGLLSGASSEQTGGPERVQHIDLDDDGDWPEEGDS